MRMPGRVYLLSVAVLARPVVVKINSSPAQNFAGKKLKPERLRKICFFPLEIVRGTYNLYSFESS